MVGGKAVIQTPITMERSISSRWPNKAKQRVETSVAKDGFNRLNGRVLPIRKG